MRLTPTLHLRLGLSCKVLGPRLLLFHKQGTSARTRFVRFGDSLLAWATTGEAPAMMKLAFASDDRATVNQHFGAALGFAIHAYDGERWQLVELAEFPPETVDGNENKLPAKTAALAGGAAAQVPAPL